MINKAIVKCQINNMLIVPIIQIIQTMDKYI